jgi:pimeloyl-ACP methyl ester carboxylesterase
MSSRFWSVPARPTSRPTLSFDYQANVASYPAWQKWLRNHQPPLLVTWGRYGPSFEAAETEAFKRDVPGTEVVLLDAGHFAP